MSKMVQDFPQHAGRSVPCRILASKMVQLHWLLCTSVNILEAHNRRFQRGQRRVRLQISVSEQSVSNRAGFARLPGVGQNLDGPGARP